MVSDFLFGKFHILGKVDRPVFHGFFAHVAFHQGGLAHAVAAHQAGALTLGHAQLQGPEGVTLAVELVGLFNLKHYASSSRYNLITSGSLET